METQTSLPVEDVHQCMKEFWREIESVIIGRHKEIQLMFVALLSQGHVLVEDLPGTGKTTMSKAFSKALDFQFARVQCTPDLLPSDVVGSSIYKPHTGDFILKKGPVFTNILLVDEINRALPRTQSSLLEAMEENQVSIEGETHALKQPFMVLATQNPIEMEGTFPLPEAQMDRFLMRITLGYPSLEEEQLMLKSVGDHIPYDQIRGIFSPKLIQSMQLQSRQVQVREEIIQYISRLAASTRQHEEIQVGVSPRGSKALYKTVKAWAFLQGRNYVTPDDVKNMIPPVWNHRLILRPEARINQVTAVSLLKRITESVEAPKEKILHHDK